MQHTVSNDPATTFLGVRRNDNLESHKNLNVRIYGSPKLETTQMSFNKQRDKDKFFDLVKTQKPTPNLRIHFNGVINYLYKEIHSETHSNQFLTNANKWVTEPHSAK